MSVGRPWILHETCRKCHIHKEFPSGNKGGSIRTVASSQKCVARFWPLKCTWSWWKKYFSLYDISTLWAYLEKDRPFTLTGTATINLNCLQNMVFVKQSIKLENVTCKRDTNSSGICFPAKIVSGKLCRNIQEEIALCIQVQIYPQTECLVEVLLGKDWLSFLCISACGAVSLKFCFIPKKDKLGLLCGVALIWLLVT